MPSSLLQMQREPLLTWKPDLLPGMLEYTVPNNGVDKDILTTQANEQAAAKRLKHQWNPKQVGGVWNVPTEDAEFKL